MRALVFPGQGSQFVGMGKDLAEAFPEARDVFQEIDDQLNQKLFKLMTEGPDSDLNLTENTQPALMAVSLAVWAVLRKQGRLLPESFCAFMAGHSLGEYSALTAAGALQLSDTARLLKTRGQAMQKAVPLGVGAMAAILGLNFEAVQDIAAEATKTVNHHEIVEAANDNSDGQVVISGHVGAVNAAIALATTRGAKRAVALPVSAPFHSRLMAPAAQTMAYTLAETTIRPPAVPIVSNVTAKAEKEPAQLRRLLVDQITGVVRWRESVQFMAAQGVQDMIEIGAGKVLTGLGKRIAPEMRLVTIGTPQDIESFLKSLG